MMRKPESRVSRRLNGKSEIDETIVATGGRMSARLSLRLRIPSASGRLPVDLPDRMEALHFRLVTGSSLGLLRCRRAAGRVDCRLLDRWPALSMTEMETVQTDNRCRRLWRIESGLLARSGEADYGMLLLDVEVISREAGYSDYRIESRVDDYPSRFLSRIPRSLAIGRLYLWVHRRVTLTYLRRLSRELSDELCGEVGREGSGCRTFERNDMGNR